MKEDSQRQDDEDRQKEMDEESRQYKPWIVLTGQVFRADEAL